MTTFIVSVAAAEKTAGAGTSCTSAPSTMIGIGKHVAAHEDSAGASYHEKLGILKPIDAFLACKLVGSDSEISALFGQMALGKDASRLSGDFWSDVVGEITMSSAVYKAARLIMGGCVTHTEIVIREECTGQRDKCPHRYVCSLYEDPEVPKKLKIRKPKTIDNHLFGKRHLAVHTSMAEGEYRRRHVTSDKAYETLNGYIHIPLRLPYWALCILSFYLQCQREAGAGYSDPSYYVGWICSNMFSLTTEEFLSQVAQVLSGDNPDAFREHPADMTCAELCAVAVVLVEMAAGSADFTEISRSTPTSVALRAWEIAHSHFPDCPAALGSPNLKEVQDMQADSVDAFWRAKEETAASSAAKTQSAKQVDKTRQRLKQRNDIADITHLLQLE